MALAAEPATENVCFLLRFYIVGKARKKWASRSGVEVIVEKAMKDLLQYVNVVFKTLNLEISRYFEDYAKGGF